DRCTERVGPLSGGASTCRSRNAESLGISSDRAPLRPLPRKGFGLSADERMEPSDWRLSGGDPIRKAAFLLARYQRVRRTAGQGLSPSGNVESGTERHR